MVHYHVVATPIQDPVPDFPRRAVHLGRQRTREPGPRLGAKVLGDLRGRKLTGASGQFVRWGGWDGREMAADANSSVPCLVFFLGGFKGDDDEHPQQSTGS